MALATFQGTAYADMRCGTNLVSEGASTYEVRKKCGLPAHREVMPAAPASNTSHQRHAAMVEHWVYGPKNGATYELKFIDGRLVSIHSSR